MNEEGFEKYFHSTKFKDHLKERPESAWRAATRAGITMDFAGSLPEERSRFKIFDITLEALEKILLDLWNLTDDQKAASCIYLGTDFDNEIGRFKREGKRPRGSKIHPSLEELALVHYKCDISTNESIDQRAGLVHAVYPIYGIDESRVVSKQGVLAISRPLGPIPRTKDDPFTESEEIAIRQIVKVLGCAVSNADLEERTLRDALVRSVYSRRAYEEHLTNIIKTINVYRKPLSLVFMDIDNFKKLNDDYSHLIGDQVLFQLGEKLKGRGGCAYRFVCDAFT